MAAATTIQYYELYRGSTIGDCLIDTIDELINEGRIEPQLAMKILATFDRVVSDVLAEKVKARLNFKGHLETYRFCDDVWTFLVKDVKFKTDTSSEFHADKVKIRWSEKSSSASKHCNGVGVFKLTLKKNPGPQEYLQHNDEIIEDLLKDQLKFTDHDIVGEDSSMTRTGYEEIYCLHQWRTNGQARY